MLLLIYFIFFLILNLKFRSVSIFLVLIQIISLTGIFLIGRDYSIDTFQKIINLAFTAFILTIIILPWMKYNNICEIYFVNEQKLKRLTYLILGISFFTFITLLVTTLFVLLLVDDINTFKYAEGVSTEFYYSLPFNVKALIMSTYLYNISYFLIPLHFYYLAKKKYQLSILCFILSLNIVLYGLTFFSRSVFANYALIYFSFLILLYNTLDVQIKKYIKKTIIVISILFSVYFIHITNKRFINDNLYSELIPTKAIIQDPVLYSYFDYLSQWYYNSMSVLNSYNYTTFKGQISLQPILNVFGQYGIINYDSANYSNLRQQLWPQNWYTFNGFVAYSIYDYGYILTIIISLIYYVIVRKLKPKYDQISLLHLFYLVLLIQIPLMAIFYSTVASIIVPFIFLVPIFLYFKITRIRKPEMHLEI